MVEVGNPESSLAILDLHTFKGIVVATAAPNSGKAVDYCSYPTFKKPTDITGLVKSLTGFEIAGPPARQTSQPPVWTPTRSNKG